MNLLGASTAQHLYELHHGGATHDGVVNHYQALTCNVVFKRVELHAHTHGAQLLRRLNKGAAHVAILDETLAVRNPTLVRVTLRRRHARVGHANNHVGLNRRLASKHAAHVIAAGVDALAIHDGVGARKVDLLKNALSTALRRHSLLGNQTFGIDAQNLARANVAHVLSTHNVQGAGLGRNHPAARYSNLGRICRLTLVKRRKLCHVLGICLVKALIYELSQHERTNTMRIAKSVQRALVNKRHGVAAAHELHGLTDALTQMTCGLRKVANQLSGYLGVGIRKEGHAQFNQLTAQLVGVHQRAVVGKRDDDLVNGREVRLRSLPTLGACRAITHMTHGKLAG